MNMSTIVEKIAQAETERQRIVANIADAYTEAEAKGATMPATENSANLADTIASIPTSSIVKEKDVNFYDYDGTVLYSYTFSEAAQLSVLPVLPEHTGLTAQGWTHTLSQIHTSVTKGYAVDVGATYTTSDGSSRFYIALPTNRYLTVPLNFELLPSGTVTVDWGDGTTTTETGPTSHTYSPASYPANYVIKVTLISGDLTWQGNTITNSSSVFGEDLQYTTMLKKAEIGVGSVGIRAFNHCAALKNVVISRSATSSIGAYAFNKCSALKSVVIPYTVTSIDESAFSDCCALTSVVIPHTVTSIGNYAFYNCSALTSVVLPGSLRSIDQSVFNSCKSLASLVIPDSVLYIDMFAFGSCDSLISLVIPDSMRALYSSWFGGAHLSLLDLTAFDSETIPYLEGPFSGSPLIVVKNQTMVETFSAATNWCEYADRIVAKDW
jgi:hypothetical protein